MAYDICMFLLEGIEELFHLPDKLDTLFLLSLHFSQNFTLYFLCLILCLLRVSGSWKSIDLGFLLMIIQLNIDLHKLDFLVALLSAANALLTLSCCSRHIALVHHPVFVIAIDSFL